MTERPASRFANRRVALILAGVAGLAVGLAGVYGIAKGASFRANSTAGKPLTLAN